MHRSAGNSIPETSIFQGSFKSYRSQWYVVARKASKPTGGAADDYTKKELI